MFKIYKYKYDICNLQRYFLCSFFFIYIFHKCSNEESEMQSTTTSTSTSLSETYLHTYTIFAYGDDDSVAHNHHGKSIFRGDIPSPTCKMYTRVTLPEMMRWTASRKWDREKEQASAYQLKTRKCAPSFAESSANGMSKIMAKSSPTSVIFSFKTMDFRFVVVAKTLFLVF